MADDIYSKVTKLDRRLGKLERRPMASSSGASGGDGDVTEAELAAALLTAATYANEQDAAVLLQAATYANEQDAATLLAAATYTNEQIAALEVGAGWDATTVTLDFDADEGLTGPYVLTQPIGESANVPSIASERQRFTAGPSNDGNLREIYGIPGTEDLADSEIRATWPATSIDIAGTQLWQPGNAHRLTHDRIDGPSGTATAGGASTLTDTTQLWAADQFAGVNRYYVTITAGTGAGQTRHIVDNNATQLTVNTAWTTNPDNTSVYEVWHWRVRALVWAPNVAFGLHGLINFYTWDGIDYDTVGSFDAQDYLGSLGGPFTLPWNIKSRVVGNVTECAVWIEGDPEPTYDTPGQSGRFTIPDGWGTPGECGIYVGHLPASGWLEVDDVTVTGRTESSEHQQQIVGWTDTPGIEGLHIDASLGDLVLAIVGAPGGAVFPPTNPRPSQFLTVKLVQGPTGYGVIFDPIFGNAPIPDTTPGAVTEATWRYDGASWGLVGGGAMLADETYVPYVFSQPGPFVPVVGTRYNVRQAGELVTFEVWLTEAGTSSTVVRLLRNGSPVAGSQLTLGSGVFEASTALSVALDEDDYLQVEILSAGTGAEGIVCEAGVNVPMANSGPRGLPGNDGAPLVETPAVSVVSLPGDHDCRSQHVCGFWAQNNVTLGADYGSDEQYAISFNSLGYANLFRRTLKPGGTTVTRVERDLISDPVFYNTIGKGWTNPEPNAQGVYDVDQHNTVAVAVDQNGYLWVCGNHHSSPLKLVRSGSPMSSYSPWGQIDFVQMGYVGPNPWPEPGDDEFVPTSSGVAPDGVTGLPYSPLGQGWATSWASLIGSGDQRDEILTNTAPMRAAMNSVFSSTAATQEDYVSYPYFFRTTDGTLFLAYRHGFSGSGHWVLRRLLPDSSGFEQLGDPYFLEGTVNGPSFYNPNDQSAYLWTIQLDDDDRAHLWATWRCIDGTGADEGNADITYAIVDQLDANPRALHADGTVMVADLTTTPITRADMDVAWDTGDPSSYIETAGGSDVNADGLPFIVIPMNFPDPTVASDAMLYWKVKWDGADWELSPVVYFGEGLTHYAYSRPESRTGTFCDRESGREYFMFRSWAAGRGGFVRVVDITNVTNPVEAVVFEMDLADWEPSIDVRALRERNEVHTYVAPMFADNGQANTDPTNIRHVPYFHGDENWQHQWAGILSLDLSQSARLTNLVGACPGIEVVASGSASVAAGGVTVGGTETSIPFAVPLPADQSGQGLFVKVQVTGGTTGTAVGRIRIKTSGQSVDIGAPGLTTQTGRITMQGATRHWGTGWIFIPATALAQLYSAQNNVDRPGSSTWGAGAGLVFLTAQLVSGSGTVVYQQASIQVGRLRPDLTYQPGPFY